MNNNTQALEGAVRRAATDFFFLGSILEAYKEAENMDENQLAAFLECSKSSLTLLSLCRRPATDPSNFRKDILHLCIRFGVNQKRLVEVIKQAEVVPALQRAVFDTRKSNSYLLAARDKDNSDAREEK